ncbi:hypothetical protein CNZW441b_0919 [Campylobacter novaezeelandiae]|uniref:Transmembrane protein n=1 Tax=Campylobacter novaezeelandiae TaxID=2267891 RepID=A0A4Q9JVK5_9BACT|nr:hypothetical protein [Campylobacter novaezeelandiae]QWU80233.1 hypothetical protein CNZW441b_0919 [Campylobacter novaezeelandiae]TBR80292.1 hypothetical protein DU473_05855 [Campylobacter novaezeelandiae]
MKKSKNQGSFISFNQLIYTQKQGEFDNDSLFINTTKELNLTPAFKYQMSFVKQNDTYHIFFTLIENLNSLKFCYPEPLLFKVLFDEKIIKESNFALINFNENFTFLTFYQNGNLCTIKNLPQFSLKDINLKNQNEREKLFFEILFEQGRVLELLKYYKTQIFILHRDQFKFSQFLMKHIDIPFLNLENILKENALEKLSVLAQKHLDNDANFIKITKTNFTPYLKIIVFFLLCYCFSLAILFLKNYPSYKESQITKKYNQNLNYEFEKIIKQNNNIKQENQELNSMINNQKLLLKQNENILLELNKNFILNNQTRTLFEFISLLNQKNIQILTLSLSNYTIMVSFYNKDNFKKTLELFNDKSSFKIIDKDETALKISLGYKND